VKIHLIFSPISILENLTGFILVIFLFKLKVNILTIIKLNSKKLKKKKSYDRSQRNIFPYIDFLKKGKNLKITKNEKK
jgi:hypothetical protein